MASLKTLLRQLPHRYRRPLVLFSVSLLSVAIIVVVWLLNPCNRDAVLAWSGPIFAILILAIELAYSAFLDQDDTEIIPNFDSIFKRTVEIISWCASDPSGELLITSATPVFGLELEPRQRKEIQDLLRARIVTKRRTRFICLNPQPAHEETRSPLEQFCEVLSESKHTDLTTNELLIRARDDLIEFGQLVVNQERAELRIGLEPPYNIILAKNSKGGRRGLLYIASTSTLKAKVEVQGLDIGSSQFGKVIEEMFEFMWKSLDPEGYASFDQRTCIHLLRDRQLENLHKQQTKEAQDVEVGGIKLNVLPDVFPPDQGYGIPLILESIATVATTEFKDVPRNELVGIDVGTGSGILAMKLAEYCKFVYATDILEVAVQNASINLRQLKSERNDFDFEVLQGDLLSPVSERVKGARALLIVFNQPYYPSPLNLFGTLVPEGGTVIIERFLSQVRKLLEGVNGIVLMPYSPIAAEHNPLNIAPRHGMRASLDEQHATKNDDVCILRLATSIQSTSFAPDSELTNP